MIDNIKFDKVVKSCENCKYHYDNGYHMCKVLHMECPDDCEFFCKYFIRIN